MQIICNSWACPWVPCTLPSLLPVAQPIQEPGCRLESTGLGAEEALQELGLFLLNASNVLKKHLLPDHVGGKNIPAWHPYPPKKLSENPPSLELIHK